MMEMKWPRKHLEKHQSRILFNEENELLFVSCIYIENTSMVDSIKGVPFIRYKMSNGLRLS